MMDNLILSVLVELFGGTLEHYLAKNDRKINMPIGLIYMISFSIIYSVSIAFTSIVYFVKGFPIPWKSIGLFSIIISLFISTVLFCLKKIVK